MADGHQEAIDRREIPAGIRRGIALTSARAAPLVLLLVVRVHASRNPVACAHTRANAYGGRDCRWRRRMLSRSVPGRCQELASGSGGAPDLTTPPKAGHGSTAPWHFALRRESTRKNHELSSSAQAAEVKNSAAVICRADRSPRRGTFRLTGPCRVDVHFPRARMRSHARLTRRGRARPKGGPNVARRSAWDSRRAVRACARGNAPIRRRRSLLPLLSGRDRRANPVLTPPALSPPRGWRPL